MTTMFLCKHPILIAPSCVLAFIMTVIHALLVGENAHTQGHIGSKKTQRSEDSSAKTVNNN